MIDELLQAGPVVMNVGLPTFADVLASQGVPVVHVEWSPPPDDRLAAILAELG